MSSYIIRPTSLSIAVHSRRSTMMYSVALLILATATCCLSTSLSDEKYLVNTLLKDDVAFTSVRPAGDSNHTVRVGMGITLNAVKSFDTSTGDMELVIWKTLAWADSRLMWDKEQFGGIDHIQLPSSKIWTPDIVLYTGTEVTLPPEKAVVVRNDSVVYMPISVVQVPCEPDHSSPDRWTCTLTYGSWVYNGHELDLQPLYEEVDVESSYFVIRNWRLTSSSVKRNIVHYSCCSEPYIDLAFTLTFTRIRTYGQFSIDERLQTLAKAIMDRVMQ